MPFHGFSVGDRQLVRFDSNLSCILYAALYSCIRFCCARFNKSIENTEINNNRKFCHKLWISSI